MREAHDDSLRAVEATATWIIVGIAAIAWIIVWFEWR